MDAEPPALPPADMEPPPAPPLCIVSLRTSARKLLEFSTAEPPRITRWPRGKLALMDQAMQAHGGMGLSQDTPIAHMWTWARALRLADGPDEVHLESLARDVYAGRS